MTSIAVLGAGVAGLTAGLRLTEAGHTVDVYERWPGLGGQAATIDIGGGHLLERYYHHLFTSDRHIAGLYDELGMRDEILPPTINQDTPDPECDLDYVPNRARKAKVNLSLSNSMGFGGHNVALVIARDAA